MSIVKSYDEDVKDSQPRQETFRKKRLLWCSEPEWQVKQTIDHYADTLYLLCDGDDRHCLELNVGGTVTRMMIKNPWIYV